MWYVIQVIGGKERKIADQIDKLVDSETFDRCFVPYFEVPKRYSGEWKIRKEVLFPGYVIVETKTPESFRVELGKISAMTRLLSSGDDEGGKKFIPLTDQEKILISALIGEDDHVMKMSEGVIEGDEVIVLKGPLMNMSGLVKKVDRHKRLAYLEVPMFGRRLQIKAGLEIVRKR